MATIKKTETTPNEAPAAVSFTVAEPLQHNGVDYEVGDIVMLSEKEARILLDLEVVTGDTVPDQAASTIDTTLTDLPPA